MDDKENDQAVIKNEHNPEGFVPDLNPISASWFIEAWLNNPEGFKLNIVYID